VLKNGIIRTKWRERSYFINPTLFDNKIQKLFKARSKENESGFVMNLMLFMSALKPSFEALKKSD
jgi:hypothetical protein